MQYNYNPLLLDKKEASEMRGKSIYVEYVDLEEDILKRSWGKLEDFKLFTNSNFVCTLTLSQKINMGSEEHYIPITVFIGAIKFIKIND